MATNITGKNLELTQAIKDYIDEKTGLLHNHHDGILTIDVELDVDTHHHKGDVFHVRMNVQVPGHVYTAEEKMSDLYAAVDATKGEVDRQLRKDKEKKQAKRREEQKARRQNKSAV